MGFVLSGTAAADLVSIYDYIAPANPANAARFIDQLTRVCQMLSENPRVGVDRSDVRKGLRSWAYHGYLILYEQVLGDDIRIIRIRRGAADVETMISDDEQ